MTASEREVCMERSAVDGLMRDYAKAPMVSPEAIQALESHIEAISEILDDVDLLNEVRSLGGAYVRNPAVPFKRHKDAGDFDDMSDEDYELLLDAVNDVSPVFGRASERTLVGDELDIYYGDLSECMRQMKDVLSFARCANAVHGFAVPSGHVEEFVHDVADDAEEADSLVCDETDDAVDAAESDDGPVDDDISDYFEVDDESVATEDDMYLE